jgi:hypothetical protein
MAGTLEGKNDTLVRRVVGIPPESCFFWQPLRRSPNRIHSDKGRHHAMAKTLGRESTFCVWNNTLHCAEKTVPLAISRKVDAL